MSWPLAKLDNHVDILSGFAFKSESFNDRGEGLPLVRIRDVVPGVSDTYYSGEYSSDFLLSDGDLLIGMDGDFNRARWMGGQALLNQRVCKITARADSLDQGYLYHFLPKALEKIHAETPAVTVKHLSVKGIRAIEIPLPPLPEQKRIAAILDKADAIRRKRQQAIQLADDFLRAVFLDMFGDPVTNPKGFPIGTIRDLVATADYGSSAKASETYGEYPILRMGNITYQGRIDLEELKYINLEEKEKSKYLVEKGDLLFNRTNSKELVGKTAVYDMDDPVAIAGYLIRVRPNEMGDSHYISGYLNSAHGKATLRSICKSIVGMANINAQEMQNIPIMLPSIELQRKYQELVVATRCKLQAFDAALKLAEQVFNSLSYKAFSGQL
ncbi:restriction endonuclease subunit S [Pseudomonas aeruginosa]|uniref:restriction endonuclease subunit S n=1 Tax=Pseudomonas aeruginosa TaxID=287 RepID=UPI0032B47AA7